MDPVSISASLVTLLAAGVASCKVVYNFFHCIAQAPLEIYSQDAKLKCLLQTLSDIVAVYSSLPPELQLDPDLELHIRRFIGDIQVIEAQIYVKSLKLGQSRIQNLRERCLWFSSDRRIKKFYSSLDHWNSIFSQSASTIQMKVLMRILEQTAVPAAPLPDPSVRRLAISAATAIPWAGQKINHLASPKPTSSGEENLHLKQVADYLSKLTDPVGLNVQYWHQVETSVLGAYMHVQAGQIILRTLSTDGKVAYRVLSSKEGYCLSFTFQIKRIARKRISIMFSGFYELSQLAKVSMRWNLTTSSLLTTDSPAYRAADQGSWRILRQLLERKRVSLYDRTERGDTLLHIATRKTHLELVIELLRAGSDINATNDQGETPLHLSITPHSNSKIAKHLLHSGANLHHQDLTQRTPLHTYFNRSVHEIILSHHEDMDPEITDERGMTIAHYVSWSKMSSPTDIIRCLPPNQSTLTVADHEGRTIFHFAIQRGNLGVVRQFLDQPITPAAFLQPDIYGRTVLHYAAESRRTEALDMLIARGFDIHARDLRGRTVLHHAAAKDKVEAVKRLLEVGRKSDLEVQDGDGRTPLQVAALHRAKGVIHVLQGLCEPQVLVYPGEWGNGKGQRKEGRIDFVWLMRICLMILCTAGFLQKIVCLGGNLERKGVCLEGF